MRTVLESANLQCSKRLVGGDDFNSSRFWLYCTNNPDRLLSARVFWLDARLGGMRGASSLLAALGLALHVGVRGGLAGGSSCRWTSQRNLQA